MESPPLEKGCESTITFVDIPFSLIIYLPLVISDGIISVSRRLWIVPDTNIHTITLTYGEMEIAVSIDFPEVENDEEKFEIDRVPIGTGQNGFIYKATETKLGQQRCLKIFQNSRKNKLNRELLFASIGKHCVHFSDVKSKIQIKRDTGLLCILGVPINSQSDYGAINFSFILDQLCLIHWFGFYHNDIKPGNIVRIREVSNSLQYTNSNHFMLIDFDISTSRFDFKSTDVLGTVGYAHPQLELYRNEHTDFYSLARTFKKVFAEIKRKTIESHLFPALSLVDMYYDTFNGTTKGKTINKNLFVDPSDLVQIYQSYPFLFYLFYNLAPDLERISSFKNLFWGNLALVTKSQHPYRVFGFDLFRFFNSLSPHYHSPLMSDINYLFRDKTDEAFFYFYDSVHVQSTNCELLQLLKTVVSMIYSNERDLSIHLINLFLHSFAPFPDHVFNSYSDLDHLFSFVFEDEPFKWMKNWMWSLESDEEREMLQMRKNGSIAHQTLNSV